MADTEVMTFEFDEQKFLQGTLETARSRMQQSAEEKIGGMVCPVHEQSPKIQTIGNSLDNLETEIDFCCEAFKETVEARLNA